MQGTERLARNRSGYYEIRYTENLGNGRYRSRTQSTGTKDRAEARAFLEGWRQEVAAGRLLGPDEFTIEALCDRYARAAQDRRVGKTQAICLAHLVRELGRLLPTDVTDETISEYCRVRGVSDGTLRRELNTLIAVLNFARKKRLIRSDEVPHIDLPPDSQARELFLDEDQEKVFLQEAMEDSLFEPRLTRVTRFVYLALRTGARRGAIHKLTWDRVDLKGRTVDYRVPGDRVSRKRKVPVPIDDVLLPVLERAYQERKSPFVIDQGDIRSAYETFLARSSFPWATAHILRHTCATLLLQSGATIWEVAGILGDTPETVARVYGHHAQSGLRQAIKRRA